MELKVVRIQYFSSLPGDFLLAAEGGVFRDHQKKNDLPLVEPTLGRSQYSVEANEQHTGRCQYSAQDDRNFLHRGLGCHPSFNETTSREVLLFGTSFIVTAHEVFATTTSNSL